MIHHLAEVDDRAQVAENVSVWQYAHVREFARVGSGASIGRGAYLDQGVVIGANCKIQNGAMIFNPATLEDGVFVGPGAILTNDRHPRAVTMEGQRKSTLDWEPVGVFIKEGASIGAGAVCVAPLTIGRWALVAAGAVVTSDVPDYAVVAGVPARRKGWVGSAGFPLREQDAGGRILYCPTSGRRYVIEDDERLEELL